MKPTVIALLAAASLANAGDTSTPASAEPRATNSVHAELRAIILGINAKAEAKNGVITAADIAADIESFDALLATHPGKKTDDLAQVALMKAMVYGQLLKDKATAHKIEKKLKVDFKGTPFVERISREEQGGEEEEEGQETLEIGMPFFPDFHEKDMNGQSISITRFKGKVVLVYVWASWCVPAVKDLPNVIESYKKNHDKGLEIVGICLDSDRNKLDSFLAANPGMTWPEYYDGAGWQSKIPRQYGIRNMPFAILLNAEGDVISKGLSGKQLTEAIDEAMKK